MPHFMKLSNLLVAATGIIALLSTHSLISAAPAANTRLKVLFLGDGGKLEPSERMIDIAPPMLDRNIEIVYSEDLDVLNSSTLADYHALLVYGDHPKLPAEHESSLLRYVSEGGGLISIHSGGMNFPNSKVWEQLVGARGNDSELQPIKEEIAQPDHNLTRGFKPFESTDATITLASPPKADCVMLGKRKLADGTMAPWTWVRTEGKGRVFCTAWGKDLMTWLQPGFVDLIERSIRWTSGQDVQQVMATRQLHQPFRFLPAKVPYNPPKDRNHPNIKKTWPEAQMPLSPEDSMRRMITPAGFEVCLFAAEPNIRKPMAIAWDHRGRAWVAETTDYPNQLHPDGQGNDRITICEDTDNDGKADKFTVFAEGLNIPTGLLFTNGGVIVHAAPQTLFLKDTTGDDKADVRQTLFEGWGLKDTHAGPNSLFYGFDNWIWGAVGYSGFNGKVGDSQLSFTNGIYRFVPAGTKAEFVGQGYRNMRGIGFTEEGDVFSSGANGAPSLVFQSPKRYYDMVPGMKPDSPESTYRSNRGLPVHRNFRQWDGYSSYTAGVGHHFYTARSYPPEYWNKIAFVNEPTLGVVGEFQTKFTGSSVETTNPSNLLASDDEWFSPILSQTGPDGAVWVIDWYNFIIQHNPTPAGFQHGKANAFESELRDKTHGRIYRVVFKENSGKAQPSLAKASTDELVATLAHPNQFWRLQAQRLLVEKGDKNAVPGLIALLGKTNNMEPDSNVGAIHACWTLRGLGALDDANSAAFKAVSNALKHPSAGVRANAAKALSPIASTLSPCRCCEPTNIAKSPPPSAETVTALLESGICLDKNPKVRLAAMQSLADQSESDAAGKALVDIIEVSGNPRSLQVAAMAAAHRHANGLLREAESKKLSPSLTKLVKSLREKGQNAPNASPTPKDDDRVRVDLGVLVGQMKYDKASVTVKAGQKIKLVFTNKDMMEHNLLILKPGTKEKIGALADQMATSPEGAKKDYIPDSPDVLWSSPILDPGTSHEILFTAPSQTGEYPYICTFPGHWRIMYGVMVVE